MSKTPETEKLNGRLDYSLTDAYLLMTQHARKLERERDEAIHACHIWQQGHSAIVEDRDYWRAEAERWRALSLESVDEVVIDDQTAPYGEWWEVQK